MPAPANPEPTEPFTARSLGLGVDLSRVEAVRRRFADSGESIAAWAAAREFNPRLVHQVLRGTRKCLRGESHRIAVALGVKDFARPVGDGTPLDASAS